MLVIHTTQISLTDVEVIYGLITTSHRKLEGVMKDHAVKSEINYVGERVPSDPYISFI